MRLAPDALNALIELVLVLAVLAMAVKLLLLNVWRAWLFLFPTQVQLLPEASGGTPPELIPWAQQLQALGFVPLGAHVQKSRFQRGTRSHDFAHPGEHAFATLYLSALGAATPGAGVRPARRPCAEVPLPTGHPLPRLRPPGRACLCHALPVRPGRSPALPAHAARRGRSGAHGGRSVLRSRALRLRPRRGGLPRASRGVARDPPGAAAGTRTGSGFHPARPVARWARVVPGSGAPGHSTTKH